MRRTSPSGLSFYHYLKSSDTDLTTGDETPLDDHYLKSSDTDETFLSPSTCLSWEALCPNGMQPGTFATFEPGLEQIGFPLLSSPTYCPLDETPSPSTSCLPFGALDPNGRQPGTYLTFEPGLEHIGLPTFLQTVWFPLRSKWQRIKFWSCKAGALGLVQTVLLT